MSGGPAIAAPLAVLAELTHRCPLACLYCSNPLALQRASTELDTETWRRVLGEAAQLGALQVHFSGGEPLARRDLVDLVRHASAVGLYGNLITSGIGLNRDRLAELVQAGLEHVQISLQDIDEARGDGVVDRRGTQREKRQAAALVREAGLPLTVNLVLHRGNVDRLEQMIGLAVALDAQRIEVAHTQYYGWALRNRALLLPDRAQVDAATAIITAMRRLHAGRVTIDYVTPDYHAQRPKACMGGWGNRFLNITPAGQVLPCHAAQTLPGMAFPSVVDISLEQIWFESAAFNRFRGSDWLPEPCRSCDQREIDWGGCRCQAFALTGDATRIDPACGLSPDHELMVAAVKQAGRADVAPIYRRYRNAS